MKTFKLFSITGGLLFILAFAACNNNSNQEEPDKMVSSGATSNSDTTPQASRDSIARGTVVTPVTSSTITR